MSDLHRSLSGAHRPNLNPRIHRHSSPYKRPLSGSLHASSTMGDLASLARDESSPTKSPAKPIPSSRVEKLSGSGGLTRSDSEPSLISGIKSLFSRPLQWLATPGKGASGGAKRDSLSSFGHDLEDQESPSARRDGKRVRRNSPEFTRMNGVRHGGDYEPDHQFDVQGRAVTGFMLPPLPQNVVLKPKSSRSGDKALPPSPKNFSRPLTTSQSMSYLDPPSNLLRSSPASTSAFAASPRKSGVLTRSRRLDLASLANDDDVPCADDDGEDKDQGRGQWSPWKSRYTGASAAASTAAAHRSSTPGRKVSALVDERDYAASFRGASPASPRAIRQPSTSALARAATSHNLRRHTSVTSDISLVSARGTGRSTSIRNLREPETSSLFGGSVSGERDDDRMSIDGDRAGKREGSVLDWFMHDRWDKPGSPASVAASRRLGSLAPSTSSTIRKGQMVWDSEDKVFVRESEFKASQQPHPVHKNEAERILYTLEAMRKTPLTDARHIDTQPLIGQSSRTMRRTINVPLATAAAGESAKQRRDKERLGEAGVSVMISPYGRRRMADRDARDARRHSRMASDEYRPSATPSEVGSQESKIEIESVTSRERSLSSAPTPRRSSRLRCQVTEDEVTPKPTRRSTRRGASKQPEFIDDEPPVKRSTRRTRKTTVERATSPTIPESAPAVAVPIITSTAPSPGGPSAAASTYQPRSTNEAPRGGSSLRAKSDTKRTHQGAAAYSRSQTPSSGRYSAKDEDLPDMDELEQASKIALPSFSGISFTGLQPAPSADAAPKSTPSATTQPSLALPRSGGPLARLGVSSTRPRASSPLAGGSIVAAPDSPPAAPLAKDAEAAKAPAGGFFPIGGPSVTGKPDLLTPSGSTTPTGKPPATSSFFSAPSAPSDASVPSKPAFSFGQPAEKSADKPASIPNFFGSASTATPESATPTALPSLDFGIKKPEEEVKASPVPLPSTSAPTAPLFSFGAPASETQNKEKKANGAASPFTFGAPAEKKDEPTATSSPFSFATEKKDAPAPSSGFSFGADKPATPAAGGSTTSPFSFSSPKPDSAPSKPAFSFGAPAAQEVKAPEPAKPAFSFGQPSSDTPKAAAESSKPAFSFGAPEVNAASTPASKPAFSFGASSTTPAATPPLQSTVPNGSSTPAAAPPSFGGFNFGKPAEKPEEKKDGPFGSAAAAKPSFTFGAPASNGSANGSTASPFGASSANEDAAKNPFGASAGGSAAPSFSFGSSNNAGTQPAGSSKPAAFSFGVGNSNPSAPAPAASNPFGASNAAQPSAPAFTFGASPSTAPVSNPFGSPAQAPNSFGQPEKASTPAPTSSSFNFGAPQPAAPAASAPSFSFGQTAAPASSTPTNSTFSFGQPAPVQPSGGATPAPFAFGAPAAQPGGFGGFGATGDASRFKSPTPGPDAGGFSLGVASSDAAGPGSPGGRRVKGLPRRR